MRSSHSPSPSVKGVGGAECMVKLHPFDGEEAELVTKTKLTPQMNRPQGLIQGGHRRANAPPPPRISVAPPKHMTQSTLPLLPCQMHPPRFLQLLLLPPQGHMSRLNPGPCPGDSQSNTTQYNAIIRDSQSKEHNAMQLTQDSHFSKEK